MLWVEDPLDRSLVMVDTFAPCCVCGGPTNTLDVDFSARVHKGACIHQLVVEWQEAELLAQQREIESTFL